MTKYEIMFIISPLLEEAAADQLAKDFEKVLVDRDVVVNRHSKWGKRELAYEIKKQKAGYYYVFNIQANNSDGINEFSRLALINESLLRHLIIKEEA